MISEKKVIKILTLFFFFSATTYGVFFMLFSIFGLAAGNDLILRKKTETKSGTKKYDIRQSNIRKERLTQNIFT